MIKLFEEFKFSNIGKKKPSKIIHITTSKDNTLHLYEITHIEEIANYNGNGKDYNVYLNGSTFAPKNSKLIIQAIIEKNGSTVGILKYTINDIEQPIDYYSLRYSSKSIIDYIKYYK